MQVNHLLCSHNLEFTICMLSSSLHHVWLSCPNCYITSSVFVTSIIPPLCHQPNLGQSRPRSLNHNLAICTNAFLSKEENGLQPREYLMWFFGKGISYVTITELKSVSRQNAIDRIIPRGGLALSSLLFTSNVLMASCLLDTQNVSLASIGSNTAFECILTVKRPY